MSQIQSAAQFVLQAKPTEEDYLHAQRAHASWGQVTAFKGFRNKLQTTLLLLLMLAFVALPMVSAPIGLPDVQINFGVLLAVAGIPLFIVVLLVVASLFSKRIEPPPEIVEHSLDASGQHQPTRQRAKNGVFGWVLFIGLAVMLFFLMQQKRPSAVPAAGTTEPPGELLQIPGIPFFLGAIIVSAAGVAGLIGITRRQQRQFRHQIQTFLILRTWEAFEDQLVEQDELYATSMQWTYFKKFLETPRVLMLYPDDYRFHLIPRSAFASDEQYERFIGLLMRKVPNGILQPRPPRGFTVQPLSAPPLP
jgi:hypothetical protein